MQTPHAQDIPRFMNATDWTNREQVARIEGFLNHRWWWNRTTDEEFTAVEQALHEIQEWHRIDQTHLRRWATAPHYEVRWKEIEKRIEEKTRQRKAYLFTLVRTYKTQKAQLKEHQRVFDNDPVTMRLEKNLKHLRRLKKSPWSPILSL